MKNKTGKRLLLSTFCILLISDIAVAGLNAYVNGIREIFSAAIRITLTAALMYAIWRGQTWAKWLFAILLAISLLAFGPLAFSSRNPLLIMLMALFTFTIYALIFDRSVKEFLTNKKVRIRANQAGDGNSE
jgi:hypothetical protein